VDLSATTGTGVDASAYAIAGQPPRRVMRPASRDELCEILRAAARDGQSVVPWGGGVALAHAARLERYDLALDLTRLDRVVEYDPEDLTLTAECGIPLARLAALTAAKGQDFPLEAPHAGRATLGGVLAANASGPRRLRLGSPRDRLLGARFVLGDGTLARTGGRVVKNVAGYAIHRLLCGSRGGLAILIEASLKLLPQPGSRVALIYEAGAAEIADRTRWASLLAREPAVLTVVGAAQARALPAAPRPGRFWVCVGLEEDAAHVAEEEPRLRRMLGEPVARLAGEEVAALWQTLSDLEGSGPSRITLAGPQGTPGDLAPLLNDPAGVTALEHIVFHAATGRLHLESDSDATPKLLDAAETAGFRRIGTRPSGETAPVSSPTLALRTRIREALDPGRRFGLGDRWVHSR